MSKNIDNECLFTMQQGLFLALFTTNIDQPSCKSQSTEIYRDKYVSKHRMILRTKRL